MRRTPRRSQLLRAGFSNWLWPALLAFVNYRVSLVRPGPVRWLSRIRCELHPRAGPRFIARVQDLNAPAEVFGGHEYELGGIPWESLEGILDLGGHVGSFTLWAASRSPARFMVVEPNPSVFRLLEQNVRSAGLSERVALAEAAVAPDDSVRWLVLDADSASNRLSGRPDPGKTSVQVQSRSLADVMNESGIERFDLVKMDVEGAEYGIVASVGLEVLSSARYWIVECHDRRPEAPDSISQRFEAAGFRTSLREKGPGLTLLLAVRRE